MIVTPIKIQGKKTKLIPRIMEIANGLLDSHPEIDTWVEPFLGSGVVAFNCPSRIRKVIVNDINPHIIRFYQGINEEVMTPERIRSEFAVHSENLKSGGYDYYNTVKDRFNKSFDTMDFLFLTRTGFNGVMRFNSKGLWNVPFCKNNERLSETVISELADSVDALSRLFKEKEFIFNNKSFEEIIGNAPENSIIYCDPPYYGLSVQYYKGWGEEQEMLLNELLKDKVFLYSTWINDGHKDNHMVDRLWGRYQIDSNDHKYYVACQARDRMKMVEGLIYNGKRIQSWDEPSEPLF